MPFIRKRLGIPYLMTSRKRSEFLGWLKKLILPAAKSHTSRKITATAIVTASVSGFKLVAPADEASKLFREVCLAAGVFGFVALIWLFLFPPK
jgi:hypothetical protein